MDGDAPKYIIFLAYARLSPSREKYKEWGLECACRLEEVLIIEAVIENGLNKS